MAFPAIASEVSSQQDTNATDHTVTMPSGVQAGDLLVLAWAIDGRENVSGQIPDNWVQIANTAHSGDLASIRVFTKVATGSEGASQTITITSAQCSAHHVWRITGATGTPEAAIFQGNVDTSLDPPSLNPAAWDVEDTLWLALSSSDDATSTVTGFPSGYTGTGQVNADSSADGVTLGYARRTNAAASEDPGAFTISSAEGFCTVTVGVRPVADYPQLQAEGTQPANVTTGSLTLTLPAHQADDILVAIVAIWAPNTAGSLAAIPALASWTKQGAVNFPATPDGEIAFFWRRATASGTTNPVFTRGASWDTGTDTAYGGRAFVVRGCITTGDPWDEFDPTVALTGANGAVDAVTVSDTKRTVIQFLGKTDDFVTAPTLSGWTPGTQTEDVTGTDMSFGTFRKENVSASTSADASTVEAVAQGAYVFFGVSFKPPVTSISLVVADAAQAQSADEVALTQVHSLATADASQGQTADVVALTQVHQLAIDDATHAHTADGVAVTESTDLVVADAVHAHTADQVALTQAHSLAVADSTHTTRADSPALTQAHSLVSADASHTHTADVVTLGQVHALAVADAAHAQAADSPALTQTHTLAVADAVHAQTANQVTITESGPADLAVNDAAHGHSADQVTLVQQHALTVADTAHGQTADVVALEQVHVLGIHDAHHGHTADTLAMGQVHELVVADAAHAHEAGQVSLGQFSPDVPSQGDYSPGGGALVYEDGRALVYDGSSGGLVYDP